MAGSEVHKSRLASGKAEPISSILALVIRKEGLAAGIFRHAVFNAWDSVSGAGRHTVSRFFRDGTLYVTVDSSLLRSRMLPAREALLTEVNAALDDNELLHLAGIRDRVVKIVLR